MNAFSLFFAAVMVLLRLWTLQGMPIWALSFAIHDDRMMVDIAHAVSNGGPAYNNLTLVKGWAFPLFLAVLHKLRIPYIQGMALLNAAISLMAVQASREEKRRPFHYVLFVVLLFNPAMTSAQVLMRVYRNGFSAVTAFMVVICAIAVYRRRREVKRSWIPWVLAESIALPAFWYTREDSIWLLPFVAGSALVAVVSILVGGAKPLRRAVWMLCAMLIPLAALQCTTMGIRWQREIKYGVPITNELSEGEFPRVMRALYAATVDEEEPLWVSVSREKLHTLYDYSPSLKAIEPKLEPLMDAWSAYGRSETNHNAHEVENGWFFWCLRDAAAGAGYYESLEKSQQFWKQVADELEDAEAVGKIKTRWTMPSALMPPWREGTGERLLNALVKIPGFVASFKGTDSAFVFSEGRMGREVNRFEAITSNNAVCATDESFYTDGVRALETQNRIAHLYQRIWGIVVVLAGVSAVSVLVLLFCGRNTDVCLRENVWAMLGMAGALLVLFGGVAYNHAESCFSISVLYLSASYPLMITLELVCVHACAEGIVRMKKQTEKAKNQGKAKKIR